jgi:hypothetical protein
VYFLWLVLSDDGYVMTIVYPWECDFSGAFGSVSTNYPHPLPIDPSDDFGLVTLAGCYVVFVDTAVSANYIPNPRAATSADGWVWFSEAYNTLDWVEQDVTRVTSPPDGVEFPQGANAAFMATIGGDSICSDTIPLPPAVSPGDWMYFQLEACNDSPSDAYLYIDTEWFTGPDFYVDAEQWPGTNIHVSGSSGFVRYTAVLQVPADITHFQIWIDGENGVDLYWTLVGAVLGQESGEVPEYSDPIGSPPIQSGEAFGTISNMVFSRFDNTVALWSPSNQFFNPRAHLDNSFWYRGDSSAPTRVTSVPGQSLPEGADAAFRIVKEPSSYAMFMQGPWDVAMGREVNAGDVATVSGYVHCEKTSGSSPSQQNEVYIFGYELSTLRSSGGDIFSDSTAGFVQFEISVDLVGSETGFELRVSCYDLAYDATGYVYWTNMRLNIHPKDVPAVWDHPAVVPSPPVETPQPYADGDFPGWYWAQERVGWPPTAHEDGVSESTNSGATIPSAEEFGSPHKGWSSMVGIGSLEAFGQAVDAYIPGEPYVLPNSYYTEELPVFTVTKGDIDPCANAVFLEGTDLGVQMRTIPVSSGVDGWLDKQGRDTWNELRQMTLRVRVRGTSFADLQDRIGTIQRTIVQDKWELSLKRHPDSVQWERFNMARCSPFKVPYDKRQHTHFSADLEIPVLALPEPVIVDDTDAVLVHTSVITPPHPQSAVWPLHWERDDEVSEPFRKGPNRWWFRMLSGSPKDIRVWYGKDPADAGRVSAVSIVDNGAGYEVAPTVEISGGNGSGAAAYATVSAIGRLKDIIVTNRGGGYTSTPNVAIVPAVGDAGAGGLARATVEGNLPLEIAGGVNYKLSFQAIANNFSGQFTVWVWFYKADWSPTSPTHHVAFDRTADWDTAGKVVNKSSTFVAATDAAWAQVRFNLHETSTTGSVKFRSVSLGVYYP